jgi:aspartate kinase
MLIIQKFGGTSVADVERIKMVAQRVKREIDKGNKVVAVVSAMSGVTNQLVGYARGVSMGEDNAALAEYDSIVASGEQVTSGLLALALQELGIKSRSLLGWQIPLLTDDAHGKARIAKIDDQLLNALLVDDVVPVVAGFQGIAADNRIATLGRGGSDTSAVAIAAALKADRCDIFTDVTGIFTADPRMVPKARKLNKVGYEEILEMASLGAKVLQTRSVEMAVKYGVVVQVLSSFVDEEGSLLVNDEEIMERRLITAVASDVSEARVTLVGVENTPGVCASIFEPLAASNINVDMIIQNISTDENSANVTFTINESDLERALQLFASLKDKIKYDKITSNKDVAKVSVIGVGMKTHAGIAQKMFAVLSKKGINILAITTSEIKISILIEKDYAELAVRSLHDAFELEKVGADK